MSVDASKRESEISKRRTFAIISHPDAGKTTLTEKLLLYSGMIRTAGMVRARKGGRSTSSDWMSIEQERGISISASAMQFQYKDSVINVLDTPGHQDFSEDTYRTLMAADSAIMVIDASKGVEAQTRKLFAVCAMRGIPILTFINKMDLPAKDPLDLLADLEDALGILASPVTWPIGIGREFCGVIDRPRNETMLFSKSQFGGADRANIERLGRDEGLAKVPDELRKKALEDLELLDAAGNPFDHDRFMAGKVTPVFFGSALTNFGVEPFFDEFVTLAPPPRPYLIIPDKAVDVVAKVQPTDPKFSGFIFKIQSNMNPKHRDSMAFIRICSGVFERDMTVHHSRLNKEIRLSRAYSLMSRDRETTEVAYPGDIVGAINPGVFTIGDTVSSDGEFTFPPLPKFPPEVMATVRPIDVLKKKAFDKGLEQLTAEGTVQLLFPLELSSVSCYVAAVGKLQFEVLERRLLEEYGVKTELNVLSYTSSAYVKGERAGLQLPSSATLVKDVTGQLVALFSSDWEKRYARERNKDHQFIDFVEK